MRKLTSLIIAFSLLFGLAHAAHAADGDFAYRPQLVRVDVPARAAAYRLQRAGMALTIVGTLATIASGVITPFEGNKSAFNEHCQGGGGRDNPDCNGNSNIPGFAAVMGLGIGGALMIAAGVPMWAVGAKRKGEAQRTVSISASGATLRF